MDDLRLTSLNLPGINENKRPLVIAGPCSAETEEQVMTTARQLAEKGFKIFRAGVWKPRTKPGGFEGMGEAALPWLQRVKEETGMLVSTEVAMPKHVEASLKAGVDLLWVGARTTANPFAMQELADSLKGVDIPVLVKNPVNPDIELWIGALERINGAGITRLGAIHRGFSSFDKKIFKWVSANASTTFSHYTTKGTIISGQGANRAGVVVSAITTPTYAPIWDPENPQQFYNNFYGANLTSPRENMARTDYNQDVTDRLLLSGGLTFYLAKDLTFKSTVSMDRRCVKLKILVK